MRTTYAGVIGCNMSEDFFHLLSTNIVENYHWKKVFNCGDSAPIKHKEIQTEVVTNVGSILEDNDITVVFLSNDYLHMAPQFINAGKCVRTVQ
ncbi:hypothetical protein [Aridibaculum aurantiacum]|uniref:hypothetical protein n=1 Tax=Aridibaculum aurantiacum TaxID=2810307 RepID=UPI001A970AB1|nr:hypothetical protein [Aridibaculum aurantiacum]